MFEHFTDRGRRVVVFAQEESRLLCHDFIGSEHLLLALLHQDEEADETRAALQQAGITLEPARRHVEQLRGRGKKELRGHIPFSPRAKKVLELSMRVSQRLTSPVIGEPHLLRAILDVPDSTAYQVLTGFDVDTEALARVADELALACQVEDRGSDRPFGRQGWRAYAQSGDRFVSQAAQLRAQRDALSMAVRRYGRHDDNCQPDRGCTCGLQQVLDQIDPPRG